MTRRKQPPLLYTDCAYRNLPRKVAVLRWAWSIRDGATGPLLAEGTARTARAAQRHLDRAYGRCVRRRHVVDIGHPPLHPLTYAEADAIERGLAAEGIRIMLRGDEREVALCPLAELDTWQKAAALHAVVRATDVPVHWGRAVAR